jgi:hypothetical protein
MISVPCQINQIKEDGHVGHMGRKVLHSGFCWGNMRETSLLGRIKLKQVLNE